MGNKLKQLYPIYIGFEEMGRKKNISPSLRKMPSGGCPEALLCESWWLTMAVVYTPAGYPASGPLESPCISSLPFLLIPKAASAATTDLLLRSYKSAGTGNLAAAPLRSNHIIELWDFFAFF